MQAAMQLAVCHQLQSVAVPAALCFVSEQVLTLDRDAFHAMLGRLDSLRSMWRFEALQRVPLFARLDNKTKAAVASALGQVVMPKGTAVVTQVRCRLPCSQSSRMCNNRVDVQNAYNACCECYLTARACCNTLLSHLLLAWTLPTHHVSYWLED
eukprot:GHRR01025496.1.p1 GENE.GHRR01025496.1~~GHRR01025496.1.p1  ORF type:complete len:154 (-),score=33.94 GHRR01025496.1:221-682(-)